MCFILHQVGPFSLPRTNLRDELRIVDTDAGFSATNIDDLKRTLFQAPGRTVHILKKLGLII